MFGPAQGMSMPSSGKAMKRRASVGFEDSVAGSRSMPDAKTSARMRARSQGGVSAILSTCCSGLWRSELSQHVAPIHHVAFRAASGSVQTPSWTVEVFECSQYVSRISASRSGVMRRLSSRARTQGAPQVGSLHRLRIFGLSGDRKCKARQSSRPSNTGTGDIHGRSCRKLQSRS